jgi:hypothetical protein
MAVEYKIKWKKPTNYKPVALMRSLPSPISRQMTEIYNYSLDDDGFYFRDNLVDEQVAGHAFKLFLDEALAHTNQVEVHKL